MTKDSAYIVCSLIAYTFGFVLVAILLNGIEAIKNGFVIYRYFSIIKILNRVERAKDEKSLK